MSLPRYDFCSLYDNTQVGVLVVKHISLKDVNLKEMFDTACVKCPVGQVQYELLAQFLASYIDLDSQIAYTEGVKVDGLG